MSMENVRKFLEMVKTDEKLARKVVELKDRIKADVKLGEEKEILAEKVVPLARDCNLEFTVDDFISFANSEVKNLSKEDLLAISGGKISRAPALGLLFAAVLTFAPSAMGNIPNLHLIEHVAEAATTAEEVENELVEYIKEFLKNLDLSKPGDVDVLNTFAEGNIYAWLKYKDIKVEHDAKDAKVFHCIKDGKTFDIDVNVLIERAKIALLKTQEEVENEITFFVKKYLMDEEKAAQLGYPPKIRPHEIRGEVKEVLIDIVQSVSKKDAGSVVLHCNKNGKAFDIDVNKLIYQATKDFFVSAVTYRLTESLPSKQFWNPSMAAKLYDDFKRMTSAWLLQRGIPVETFSTYRINPTGDIIKCYLFEINRKDLFNKVCTEAGLEPLPEKKTFYTPLDHRKDSWEKIVETLLKALNVADFDLNSYPLQDQQAIKNDLQWFAGYIKGSLGRCYCQGLYSSDKYGSGEPTDKITAQLNVLKAFVEDGYEFGENTKQYNIALGAF